MKLRLEGGEVVARTQFNQSEREAVSQESSEYIRLRLIASRIVRRRWWLIICIVLGALTGTAGALLMHPKYRTSVILMPTAEEEKDLGAGLGALADIGGLGQLASLAGVNIGGSDAKTNEALAVLQSRDFTERFIESHNLLPILYANKWDPKKTAWVVPQSDVPSLDDGWKVFDKSIRSVTQDDKTGLVTLTVKWKNRFDAADWANELVTEVNQEMRLRAIQSATSDLGYLGGELAHTKDVDLRTSIERLIELQQEKKMLATVNREYVFKTVDKALPPAANDPVVTRAFVLFAGIGLGLLLGLLGAIFDWA